MTTSISFSASRSFASVYVLIPAGASTEEWLSKTGRVAYFDGGKKGEPGYEEASYWLDAILTELIALHGLRQMSQLIEHGAIDTDRFIIVHHPQRHIKSMGRNRPLLSPRFS